MDLIDRVALKRRVQKVATEAWKMKMTAQVETVMNQFLDFLEQAPAIEAVPMRRTKPVVASSRDCNWYQCGNCETPIDQGDRYCRGCGAEVEWDGGSK